MLLIWKRIAEATAMNHAPTPVTPEQYEAVEDILDALREADAEVPQWEFCDGFLTALVCCRRAIAEDEFLPVLLGFGDAPDEEAQALAPFADAQQRAQFLAVWHQRMDEVRHALDTEVETLEDPRAFHPEVGDLRGDVAVLPPDERAALADQILPAFAQVWALGFLYAVETWPEEWVAPSERQAAKWFDQAMQCIVALTEDDAEPATISPFSADGPASISVQRLNAFADAAWAVYDLREIWRSIGPRVPTLRRADVPGRNDPCNCGSGKKYKKCCGSGNS